MKEGQRRNERGTEKEGRRGQKRVQEGPNERWGSDGGGTKENQGREQVRLPIFHCFQDQF